MPGDWKTGVCFETREWFQATWPDCVSDWEDCVSATLADKPIGSGDTWPECDEICFDPFTIYTPISEISVQPDLASELTGQVGDVHDALISGTIAKVLAGLDTMNGHPGEAPFCIDSGLNYTLSGADTPLGGGARAPLTAVALLLHAYALEMGTTGGAMLHVSPVVLPFLVGHGFVAQVGNRFIGPGGVIVVADAGYAGIGSATSSTAYVTGPVQVSTAAPVTIPGSTFDDARLNQWAFLIEQRAIYRFDPRGVFSVVVTTPVPGSDEV